MVEVKGCKGAPLRIYGFVGGGYCEVKRGGVSVGGEAGRSVKVEVQEVGVCLGFGDEGTPCLHLFTSCLRVPGMAMVVEVFHDDVVITEVEKKV